MSEKDFSAQSSSELEWEEVNRNMGHFGPHQPIAAGDQVVCAQCGAIAVNGDPDAFP